MAEGNKNQWVVWSLIIGAIIITFVAFNYQGDKTEVIPLSEIFPEERQDVEFEFVLGEEEETVAAPQQQAKKEEVKPHQVTPQVKAAAQTAGQATEQALSKFYTIQALSSKNKLNTEAALKKMKTTFPTAFMVSQDLEGKGVWYRIYIGKFNDKQQADSYLTSVRSTYNDSFVRLIKN